jgi:hypothetical protein
MLGCPDTDFESLWGGFLAKLVYDLVEVEVGTLLGVGVAAPLEDQLVTNGSE